VSGLLITLVVVVLTPLSQYISHGLISPDFFPNIIQFRVNSGKMTLQEAEAYFDLMNYTTQSVFFAGGMGILTTVVVMIFMKSIPQKDPSE
jgi:predicted ferric reductase